MTDKAADSRNRIIEAAISLMRRSGLSGAGINEIVAESRAPKGSIYYFFPRGKQQIVSEALAVYAQRGLAAWGQALSSVEEPGRKIHALLDAIAARTELGQYRASCAAGTVILDLDDDLEVVRLAIADAFSRWIELISVHFPIGNAERRKSFAGLVLTVIEGAFIRARAERSSKPFQDAAAWLAEIAEREVAHAPRAPRRRRTRDGT
ncbi:MAG TPA: TetR/AcrR family transcriptional regulator [Xanthobacteraceae bacterium]|jgi:TetR/AcrR family transcriptional repressor of lmrAB and yxaGH operons